MSGGNYNRGKRGMSLIAEAMEQLQVHSFLQSFDGGVFSIDHHRNVIVDFMTYTWKVSIKKGNLKTQPFFISLWSTFNFLFKWCSWVDIVFDVYKESSIKASERRQTTTGEGIETIISGFDQRLPVEIDHFLSVSKNKIALQQLFTKWILNKVQSEQFDKLLFFGGSHKENNAMCVSFVNGLVSVEMLLECTHEEADGRIFFDANHAIKIGNYGSVVMASPDTDIFLSALHHFCKLKCFDLEELWFVSGWGNSRTFFPIHGLTNDLDSDLVEVLPAINALTGWDTASKVGAKSRAVREGADCYHLLYAFGTDALSNEMIADTEKFLLKCITKYDVDTFDELHFIVYHEKYLEFDTERFPPTSDNSIYCMHIFSVIYSYTLLFWEILIWVHLNMIID